jgi:hypothetical protein
MSQLHAEKRALRRHRGNYDARNPFIAGFRLSLGETRAEESEEKSGQKGLVADNNKLH